MQKSPKVSIFMPTYNHEAFLAESLESVITQDYSDFEIVCSDDCSLDKTAETLKYYQAKYPDKIKALYSEKNLGIAKNFNKTLKYCSGKYIIFFSGDDIMLPGKITKTVNFMEENSEHVLCYHDAEIFDSYSGNKVCNYSDIARLPTNVVESLLSPGTLVVGSVVIARKSALPIGGFNENLNVLADWLLFIETATKGKVGSIQEILTRYRRHKNNVSNTTSHYPEYFCALGILRSKYINLAHSIRYYEGHVFAGFLAHYMRKAEYSNAFICAKESALRLYKLHIMLPCYFISLFRLGILKSPIDSFIAWLFKRLDKYKKLKQINYKVYGKR